MPRTTIVSGLEDSTSSQGVDGIGEAVWRIIIPVR
jgi:hypothetical protein